MASSTYRFKAQGGAAIALSAAIPAGQAHRLVSVTCHLSAAPAAAGSLTVKLNSADGGNYDTLLQTQSMVGNADFVWEPDEDMIFLGGDAIDVAYANPDARVYGVYITTKAV